MPQDIIIVELSQQGKNKGKYVAWLSPEDEYLTINRWSVAKSRNRNTVYTQSIIELSDGTFKRISMHRIVMQRILRRLLEPDEIVDHINGHGWDNRRENLRLVSPAQNAQNRRTGQNNKSGQTGVHWVVARKGWRVRIGANGKEYHVGIFANKDDAIAAYKKASLKYHGEYARKDENQK